MAGNSTNVLTGFIAAGGGTLLGSVATAFFQTMGNKGRNRAEAADLTVTAAGRIIDRLEKENIEMRKAILLITQIIDELIEDLPMNDRTKSKLRRANNAAKLAAV